jgi:hypothetical protein
MLLADVSAPDGQSGENPAMRTLALQHLVEEAPLFSVAQFYSTTGNSDTKKKDTEVNSFGHNRNLGSSYSGVTGTPDEVSVTLRTVGDVLKTDIGYERRFPGKSVASERARQIQRAAKSLGRRMTDDFINGNGSGGNVSGILSIATNDNIVYLDETLTEVQLGIDNAAKKSQQKFLRLIDTCIDRCAGMPDALFMSAKSISYLKAIGREYLTVSAVQGVFQNQELITYNGVRIINAGYAADNTTQVISDAGYSERFLETEDDMSLIVAVKFGEEENLTLPTNNGLNVKDLGIVGTNYTTLMELDWGVMLLHPKALQVGVNFICN